MKETIESMNGCLPSRETTAKLSPEEVAALYNSRLESQRVEFEALLESQRVAFEALLESQRADSEARLESQREEFEARLESQRADSEARLESQRADFEARLESQKQQYEARLTEMQKENNSLKRKLNTNSNNSGNPPSKDPPWFDRSAGKRDTPGDSGDGTKPPSDGSDSGDGAKPPSGGGDGTKPPVEGKPRRRGGQKGHTGASSKRLTPDDSRDIYPVRCKCGCENFDNMYLFHTRQYLELPPFLVRVLHVRLYSGECCHCGKQVKARLPHEYTTGYGPGMTSLVGILFGTMGSSARQIADFFNSGLFRTSAGEDVKVSLGSVMNLRQRCSQALESHYNAIANVARKAPVNHIDETSWPTFGPEGKGRNWLWVMVSGLVAFFMIHPHRSREAFEKLIGSWQGYLISDDYGLYRKWTAENRQSCLAHLLRAAKKLSEDPEQDIAKWGARLLKELGRLSQMSKQGPTRGEWQAWVMRIKRLFHKLKDRDGNLGSLVSRLDKHFPSLSTFLRVPGVEPTNNRAERSLRPAVVRRKVSYGSTDECGLRWSERLYSVLLTCKLNSWSFVDLLREAVTRFLFNEPQNLSCYRKLRRKAVEASAQLGLVPATP